MYSYDETVFNNANCPCFDSLNICLTIVHLVTITWLRVIRSLDKLMVSNLIPSKDSDDNDDDDDDDDASSEAGVLIFSSISIDLDLSR